MCAQNVGGDVYLGFGDAGMMCLECWDAGMMCVGCKDAVPEALGTKPGLCSAASSHCPEAKAHPGPHIPSPQSSCPSVRGSLHLPQPCGTTRARPCAHGCHRALGKGTPSSTRTQLRAAPGCPYRPLPIQCCV